MTEDELKILWEKVIGLCKVLFQLSSGKGEETYLSL
jgi:hypothetical protein